MDFIPRITTLVELPGPLAPDWIWTPATFPTSEFTKFASFTALRDSEFTF